MEADQLICAIKSERKAMKKRYRSLQKATYEECSYPDQKEADPSNKKLVLRKFANYCRYLKSLFSCMSSSNIIRIKQRENSNQ